VLVATTGLALRHVPMSVRLSQVIGRQPPAVRAALAWVLVDETFGMTLDASRREVPDLVAYKAAADLLLYSGWVLGTVAGTVFGAAVDPDRWGASILFPLVFLGLAAPLVRTRRHWLVAALAVGAALLSVEVLPEAWRITGAAAAAAAVGGLIHE
jgi:predicted branched-subunit amino acid permease